MVGLVLLEVLHFVLKVADLGLITSSFSRFDLSFVLSDVLVDRVHAMRPERSGCSTSATPYGLCGGCGAICDGLLIRLSLFFAARGEGCG